MVSPRTLLMIIKKHVLASIGGKIKNIIHPYPSELGNGRQFLPSGVMFTKLSRSASRWLVDAIFCIT